MNWGYRILFAFLLGAAFITFLVVRSFGVHTDMVEENYYSKELQFDNQIHAVANLSGHPDAVHITQNGKQIVLQLAPAFASQLDSGTLLFYFAANAKSDQRINLQKSTDGTYLVNCRGWKKGKYVAKLSFSSQGKSYYKEETLFVE